MTVMPSERIFVIFLVAPLLMFVWEHVVRDPHAPAAAHPLFAAGLFHSPAPTPHRRVSRVVQVLDHQHVHPLADGTTAGCGDVGCDDGCGDVPDEAPESATPGSGWAFKPKKAKPGEKTSLLGKGKKGTVMPSGEAGAPAAASGAEGDASSWMPRVLQPGCQPVWLIWLFEKWALLMRLGAPALFQQWHPRRRHLHQNRQPGTSPAVCLPPPSASQCAAPFLLLAQRVLNLDCAAYILQPFLSPRLAHTLRRRLAHPLVL